MNQNWGPDQQSENAFIQPDDPAYAQPAGEVNEPQEQAMDPQGYYAPYSPDATEQYAASEQYDDDAQYGTPDMPQDGLYGDGIRDDAPAGEEGEAYAENEQDFPEEEEEPEGETEPVRKWRFFKPRERKPSFALAVIVNSFRVLCILAAVLCLAAAGYIVGIARGYVNTAPLLDLAAIDDQAQTSFIYDAQGNLITDYKGTENRIMVSLDTMPLKLRNAFVAVEDARFYTHNGIDIKRIIGSFVANTLTGSNQGGSTITQQLIKNTLLSSEQSYKRKIQEAYLAMQLETRYTKDQILESYLNTIYMGEDYYGVKVAASGYFGRENLSDLSLRECAMLAGLCRSPYYYNPRRNYYLRHSDTVDYKKRTDDRTDYVLRCMLENHFITQEEYTAALDPSSARILAESPASTALYKYPHYVEYAMQDAVRILTELNGLENTAANRSAMEKELRTGGYSVYLALDTDIQTTVEDTLYNYSDYPALRDPSDSVYRAKNSDGTYTEIPQPQAAAVVMDHRTGEVKAIVGGRTRPTQRKTLNRAVNMNMPVGSSIKPIAVYAPALELGAGAGTILYNMPIPVTGWTGSNGEDTWPENYGGSSYRGPETLRKALTQSDNTAAAYAMMNLVGVDRAADYLLRMGVSEKRINRTPFGVSLGSSGITPFEMAVAYSTLAAGGVWQEPITVLAILGPDHKTVYDAHQTQERRQVFKPSTAYLTVDILKDAVSSGTGKNAKISGQTVAGKTGTNSDQKGVFFAGMTGWYTATVWIGHDNYKSLSSKTTGGSAAAKLWKSFMAKIHSDKNLSNRDIMEGDPSQYGLVKVTTCAVSGQLATDACLQDAMGYGTVTDWWPADSVPGTYCQMHVTMTICRDSGMLATDNCPMTSRENRSVVVIPRGHPLYQYIGTRYEGVLIDYLGQFASLRLTDDTNANLALLSTRACTLHTEGWQSRNAVQGASEELLRDAQSLLTSARLLLATLPAQSGAYRSLSGAIGYLESCTYEGVDTDTLSGAMAVLTQAMADAQWGY